VCSQWTGHGGVCKQRGRVLDAGKQQTQANGSEAVCCCRNPCNIQQHIECGCSLDNDRQVLLMALC
jgi:hypothetical protein